MKPLNIIAITIAVFICLLFKSCVKQLHFSENEYHISDIDSYGDYTIKGQTFVVASGMDGVSEKELEFREFADLATKALIRKGAIKASSNNQADLLVLLQYGMSDPEVYQEDIPVPIYGKTGIASATTTTETSSKTTGIGTSSIGKTANSVSGSSDTDKTTTSKTDYKYNYGVTGVYTKTVRHTVYYKYCNIYAFDNKAKSDDMLWKTNIGSAGSSGDLRNVLPYMLYAGMDYFGYNSGKKITLYAKDDNSVNILKKTKLEADPNFVYAPEYSSNSRYISVTEVNFNSHFTRVYFRVVGLAETWLQCSKKTVMTVNGNSEEYIITDCSAGYKPNKVVFQADGEIYDFYMDFPALNRDNVKFIEIEELEKDGLAFEIQL